MIRRIVLENFMSHRRTVIEPAEGLTVLVGPNNCGKSAVVVALQCMNTCDSRSAPFIRHGQKEARVLVETSEGSKIDWVRGKNFTNYKINGREMTRARRPEDLDEHLRLAEVVSEDGKRTFDLHFAEQKNPIFLLNESGAAAATFFAASSDAAYLVQMQSLLKRRESDARTQKRDLERRVDRQRRQMAIFEALPTVDKEVKRAQDAYANIQADSARVILLQEVQFSIREASLDYEAYGADLNALSDLKVPPDISDSDPLARTTLRLEDLTERSNRSGEMLNALHALFIPPDLSDTAGLTESIQSIGAKTRRNRRLKEKLEISEQAPPLPSLDDPSSLISSVSALEARVFELKRSKELLDEILVELEGARATVVAYLRENPTCPVCGSMVTPERLLA